MKTRLLNKLSPAQLIIVYYVVSVTISTILLNLPVSLKPGVEWEFIDILFMAVSAVSVTGLSVVDVGQTFSTTGLFLLMFVLQFGGIGIMSLGTFFWLILGRKIGLKERQLIMTDQNQTKLSGLVKLLIQIVQIILFIEIAGAIILGLYFLNYFPDWKEAFLHGLFLSVSATTNAGFDISGSSMIPYAKDYFIQIITIILITLGAIGFPVLIEVKEYFSRNHYPYKYRFSLFTKITSFTFGALIVVGTVLIFLLERNGFFTDKTWTETFFYSLFISSNTRSGGLTTMDVNQFSEPTTLLLSFLMFIGASPSSVGGGIRTTTFAIMFLFVINFATGNRAIKVFKREICEEDIYKAVAVMTMGLTMCFLSIFIMTITESLTISEIIFEVCSAFGSVGLSLGITAKLSFTGKIVVMILMFIGRVGIISFLFIIGRQEKTGHYQYPKEKIIIG
ncbi:Trk-type K+ transport system membrane component [Peribacillus deserti]|uniref:Trk-type K+ transport system membrane component n=1 Tax=Peribacillus deserti TaxID=673318 RepID=A0ABS2QD66_9BACI|nr:TrkH family potassium uptake protein [Peribacillus deserti]MBM7691111.1 Trk-type K+ transport system membrane component [Peribacillus deserti]